MATEYTDVAEFKRLIEERKIKPERVRSYLKTKGMIFTSANAEAFAKHLYTVFLGSREMTEITEMFQSDSSYEKSLLLKAKANEELEPESTIIDFFAGEIARFRNSNSAYSVEQPMRSEDARQLTFYTSYVKKSPGKNKLLQSDRRTLRINMREISADEVVIDIRQQSSSDATEALKLLKLIEGKPDESAFSLIYVNLLSLPPKSSVAFFERLRNTKFEGWKLKTITGITLKRSNSASDESENDEDEEDVLGEEDIVSEEALAGINQAALSGSGLHHNQFVKDTLAQGYVISSMRFRYACKLNEEFAVAISVKGKNLRIDIDKTYVEEKGRMLDSPFPKTRQDEIILAFQNASNSICTDLRNQILEGLEALENSD